MIEKNTIRQLAEEKLASSDYFVVDVEIKPGNVIVVEIDSDNEVEMLLKAGKKLTGILKDANEENVTLTVEKQVKPEGAKRKITVEEDQTYSYDEIKYTKYLIRFK